MLHLYSDSLCRTADSVSVDVPTPSLLFTAYIVVLQMVRSSLYLPHWCTRVYAGFGKPALIHGGASEGLPVSPNVELMFTTKLLVLFRTEVRFTKIVRDSLTSVACMADGRYVVVAWRLSACSHCNTIMGPGILHSVLLFEVCTSLTLPCQPSQHQFHTTSSLSHPTIPDYTVRPFPYLSLATRRHLRHRH